MSESDDDIIDVVTPDGEHEEDVFVSTSQEDFSSVATVSADEGVSDRENSDEEEEFITEESSGDEQDSGEIADRSEDDGQEEFKPKIVKKEVDEDDRQTPPLAADSSSASSTFPPPLATAIVRLHSPGREKAPFPFNRASRLPNILSRQVRKRRIVGAASAPRMKKDDPVVKERVLEILKNAEVQMQEVVKKPLTLPVRKYHFPFPTNIKLKMIECDPLDLQQSLRKITRVDFGNNGDNKCFVISDKLKKMIVEFEQATSHLEKYPGGRSLKSCHLDLLIAIESQLNCECTQNREKQYIVKHLSDHCGIFPLALMNKIHRRRKELREEAAYLNAVMGGQPSLSSTDLNTKEKADGGGINEGNHVKLSDLQRRINEHKSPAEIKKNMAILVPRPKYLICKPRVFKLNPSAENKDVRLTELPSRGGIVPTAPDAFMKTPKMENGEDESNSSVAKGAELAVEEMKEEKQAADSTTSPISPQPYPEPSSTTVDCNSPPLKFRKIVRRVPVIPGSKPITSQLTSRPVRPNSTHIKPLPGSLADTMTVVQRTAVTSIKMRIDELRAERTKVLASHGRVMDRMNHLEQTAIPSFLMKMNLSSRTEAMEAHLNKVNQYKGLKLERQGLVDKIGKINDDICNLLSASYSSV